MCISSYSERYALLNVYYNERMIIVFTQVSKKEQSAVEYQRFSRQLFHACLAYIYSPLKLAMTTPEVVMCPDGHFCCAIYSIGTYIADYPEQVWLTGTVQNWCPKYVGQIIWVSWYIYMLFLSRCDAQPDNLDDFMAHLWTHEKTDFLCQLFNPSIVWDEYGLQSDVVVSWTISLSDIEITVNISLAIYSWIPMCRYSWANHTRSPSSTHQRGL
jgi:hypothetical protein